MTSQQLVMLALQASVFLMVFSFGLRATLEDPLYLERRPGLLARSLISMFVVMPALAVAISLAFELKPAVEIALVALSLSPVPPLLPNREGKAGGHNPYALGLLSIAGLLSIVIIPFGARLIGRVFGQPFDMSSGAIAELVLKTIIVPLAVGVMIRKFAPTIAPKIAKPANLIATVLLLLGAVAILAAVHTAAYNLTGGGTILAMVAFIAIGLVTGHWLGAPDPGERAVLALSTANRHPAIALTIAKANFPDEPFLGAAIVLYLLVGLVVGAVYVVRQKRTVAALSAS